MIPRITDIINKNISLFDNFKRVFLFGSIVKHGVSTNDIDILLVYTNLDEKTVSDLKNIRQVLTQEIGIPVDLTVLSESECEEMNFLSKIKKIVTLK